MAAPNPDPSWADFESLRHSIKSHTVDRLKHIITGFSEECRAPMSKSGKKQELIERITKQLDSYYGMRTANYAAATEQWNHARSVLHQVRTSGVYTSRRSSLAAQQISSSTSPYNTLSPSRSFMNGHQYSHNSAGPSSIGRLDPYSAQRRPLPQASGSISANSGLNHGLRFRASPFFRFDQNVSAPVECPGSLGSTDRRSQTLHFTLAPDQMQKLTSAGSKYQLRLFCTSSSFYSPAIQSNTYCPIEFPPTCEVRVNNVQISANLKGVKKKPGTAPPADIGKLMLLRPTAQNKVEMVYVDSQRGNRQQAGDSHHEEPPKKFYLLVSLVETTSVEQLVERLRKGKYRTAEEIRSIYAKSVSDDDDVIAGDQTMSLKCPLSYARIETPCRSEKCVHPQCFDATSWYSVMEQTTTWLCPVCEKVLNIEDLIVDGYFDNILQKTPDSVEDVILEPDGEWHSADKKYGSALWKARNVASVRPTYSPKKSPAVSSPISTKVEPREDSLYAESNRPKVSVSSDSIVVVDSDDEDEGRVTRELSPSYRKTSQKSIQESVLTVENGRSQSVSSRGGQAAQVIDLTESDNEDTTTLPQSQSALGKRKLDDTSAPAPSVNPTKRIRSDHRPDPMALSLPRRPVNGYADGSPSSASSNGSPTYHPSQSSRPNGASLSHVMNSPPPPPSQPQVPLPPRNGYGSSHYPQYAGYQSQPPPANTPSYSGWKDTPPVQPPYYHGANGRNWCQ